MALQMGLAIDLAGAGRGRVNPRRVKVRGWYGLINTQSMFRTLFKDTFGYIQLDSSHRSRGSLAANPVPARLAAGCGAFRRLSARAHLSSRKTRFRALRMGLGSAIEKLHGLFRRSALSPRGRGTDPAVSPHDGPQREQSVASRLERHPTPSAKNDGMSIKPAVDPGKPCLSGFLVSGELQASRLQGARVRRHCLVTMSNSPSISFTNPWIRRAFWTVASVLALWLVTWMAVPVLLKWQLQKQASQVLGRNVTVERVDFRPWSLALTLEGLRVAGASGNTEQLSVARVHVNAELQSILRLAPVIDALTIEQPRLALRHLGGGQYDVDDIVQRLRAPAPDTPSEPARFALFNIELQGGEFTLVDDTVGAIHRLRGLAVTIPFLSNL
eukprot:gene17307-35716_t